MYLDIMCTNRPERFRTGSDTAILELLPIILLLSLADVPQTSLSKGILNMLP